MTAQSAASAAYIVAALLFILALAGLSRHETAPAGNTFGIAGMAIALIATFVLTLEGGFTALQLALLITAVPHVAPSVQLAGRESALSRLAVISVLEIDAQRSLYLVLDQLVVADEAFVLENARDLDLELRSRHLDPLVVGLNSIADPREHVRDRICHRHLFIPPMFERAYQLAFVTPGM